MYVASRYTQEQYTKPKDLFWAPSFESCRDALAEIRRRLQI